MEMDDKIKIHLGCGRWTKEGFIGIDKEPYPNVDIVHDISYGLNFLSDNFVDEIYIIHFIEYIYWGIDKFFKEIHRVCKDRAKITMIVPYYTYYGAYYPGMQLFFLKIGFLHMKILINYLKLNP